MGRAGAVTLLAGGAGETALGEIRMSEEQERMERLTGEDQRA